ncbi:uncharacterized protein LOC116175457 isoform X1 [Photinus pyralis]|uniref:uncharacterized protein LOC116175457 isoform X1 n=1 Tax=Photinus pyralis TaxID=7054 RepID=UPI0012675F8B|nr:uncharacterized protein LOC116175457 isoform X1 [Photinus pyralis]
MFQVSPMAYCVVSFEDGTFSELPSNWLVGNKEQCWWPRGPLIKNINSLMEKCVEPNGKNWEQHPVKVEFYCSSLHTARLKALDPEYTSSEEKGRGRRKIKRKNLSDSDSEKECETPPPQFTCSTFQSQSDFQCSNVELTMADVPLIILPSGDNSSGVDEAAAQVSPVTSRTATPILSQVVTPINLSTATLSTPVVTPSSSRTITPSFSDPVQTCNRVLELSTQILFYVKSLDKRLQKLEHGADDQQGSASQLNELFNNKLPITNEEMLHQFEECLKNEPNTVASYVTFIKKLGGSTYQEFVNRSLKNTISYAFGTRCSWLGLRNNLRICDYKFIKLIKDVAYDTYRCSDTLIEKAGSEWFRLCSLRLKRQQKKDTP